MAVEWHYAKGGNQQGPVSSSELNEMVASGQLAPSDLVWKEGMDEWKPASSVKGLFGTDTPTKVPPPIPHPPRQSQQNILQKAMQWCTYPSPSFIPQPLPFKTPWSTDERTAPNIIDFVLFVVIVLSGLVAPVILADGLNARGFMPHLILFCMILGIGLPLVFFRSSMKKAQLAGRWVSKTDQADWTELSKGGTFRRSDGTSGTWDILRNGKFVDFISVNAPIDCWKILQIQPGMLKAILEVQRRDGIVTNFKKHPLDDAISNIFDDPAARSKMLISVWHYADEEEQWCQFTEDGAIVTSQGPAGRFTFSGEQPNEVIGMELADGNTNSWKVVSLTKTQLVVAEDGQTMILRKSGASKSAEAPAEPDRVTVPQESSQEKEGSGGGFLSKVWGFMTKHKCPNCNQRAGATRNRELIDQRQEVRSCVENGVGVQRHFTFSTYQVDCRCENCGHEWIFEDQSMRKA